MSEIHDYITDVIASKYTAIIAGATRDKETIRLIIAEMVKDFFAERSRWLGKRKSSKKNESSKRNIAHARLVYQAQKRKEKIDRMRKRRRKKTV